MPWLAICNYLTPDGVILVVVIPPITWQVVEICGRYVNECEDIVFLEVVKVADILLSTNKNFGNMALNYIVPLWRGQLAGYRIQDTVAVNNIVPLGRGQLAGYRIQDTVAVNNIVPLGRG